MESLYFIISNTSRCFIKDLFLSFSEFLQAIYSKKDMIYRSFCEKIFMRTNKIITFRLFMITVVLFSFHTYITAQNKSEILTGDNLKRIVPASFYFAGQSAETQMRNAAAAKLSENRYIIAGLVDTSGYSTEISGKYEGFFITDSPIKIGGKELGTGAYGFGFSKDNKVNIFDLSSKQILSVNAALDNEMKRPRPLMMSSVNQGVRLYKGKIYVLILAK